jgi:hypothetical protein
MEAQFMEINQIASVFAHLDLLEQIAELHLCVQL